MRTLTVTTRFTRKQLHMDVELLKFLYGGKFAVQIVYPGTSHLPGLAYIRVLREPLFDSQYQGTLKSVANPPFHRWVIARPEEAHLWPQREWESFNGTPYPEGVVSLRDNLLMEAHQTSDGQRLVGLAYDKRWAIKMAVAANPATPSEALEQLFEAAKSLSLSGSAARASGDKAAQTLSFLVKHPNAGESLLQRVEELGWFPTIAKAATARLSA